MPAQPVRVFCCDEVDITAPCSSAETFRLLVKFVECALKNKVKSSPAQRARDGLNDMCWRMWENEAPLRFFQDSGNGIYETHNAPTMDWIVKPFPKLQCCRHGKEYVVDMVRTTVEVPHSIRRFISREQRWAPGTFCLKSNDFPRTRASQLASLSKDSAQMASESVCAEFAKLKKELGFLRVEAIPGLLKVNASLSATQPHFGKDEEKAQETAAMIKEFKAKVFKAKVNGAGSSASSHCFAPLKPTFQNISDRLDEPDKKMEDTATSIYDLKVELDDARSSASPEHIEVLKPVFEMIAPHKGSIEGSKSRIFGAIAFDTMNRILRSVGIDVDVDMRSAWKDCLTPFEIFNLIIDCNFTDSMDRTTYNNCMELADACKLLSPSGLNSRDGLVRVLEELSWRVGYGQGMRPLVARAVESVNKIVQCTEMLDQESQLECGTWTSAEREAEEYDPWIDWEHLDSDGYFTEEEEY